MNHGSLFSGIGGFDLAAQWAGWTNVFQVEIDKFCRKVLTKHFSETDKYRDIYEFDGTKYRGSVDIISGGFPCQPFSHAGKRQGTKDNRYLWPEMLRVITEVQPSFVVGENVAGLLSMENGRTLERILADLEDAGYWVEVFIVPACAVGTWHRRDRIWILAYSRSKGYTRRERSNNEKKISEVIFPQYKTGSFKEIEEDLLSKPGCIKSYDGLPTRVVGREIKGYGNAIVPQVAFEIFKVIDEIFVKD